MNIFTLMGTILVDNTAANSSISSTGEAANRLASTLSNGIGKVGDFCEKIGSQMEQVGASLSAKVTAPIIALGGIAIKAGMNFESSMSKVQAISGATAEEMRQLEAKAKEMGASTKFSASEAGDAMTYMAMAGWDAQKMMDGLPGILSLAAADGLDLATTTDIVTDAMTAFGLTADKAGEFADILATTASSANTNVEMLGESFKYAAPVAGAFGYSAEDTALGLGLMANAGIKASMAGTSMRQILTNLTGVLELNVGGMKNWVIECENADGTMVPLRDQFVSLREAFAEMTEAERAQNAEMIAGKVGMSGLLAIMQASEEDFNNLINNIDNSAGSAQEMANIMQDNVQGQLVILGSALEGTAIAFYECIKEPLKESIIWLSNFVSSLIPVIEENGKLIAIIGGVAAAIGPVLLIGGKLISGIGTLCSVISSVIGFFSAGTTGVSGFSAALTALTGPVGIAVAAIAGIIATLVLLYQNNEQVREALNQCWEAIKQCFNSACEFIKGVIDGFIAVFTEMWTKYGTDIQEVIQSAWDAIAQTFQVVVDLITDIFKVFSAAFKGDWSGMWEAVKELASNLWNNMTDALGKWLDLLVKAVVNIGHAMLEAGKGIFNKLWEGIKSVWQSIKSWLEQVKEDPVKVITGIGSSMYNAGKQIFTKMWDGVKSVWSGIQSWVSEKVDWIKDKVTFWNNSNSIMDKGKVNGSHAGGINSVPYDGYIAELHKGERVLTASENNALNSTSGSSDNKTVVVNMYYPQVAHKNDIKTVSRQLKQQITGGDRALGL